MMKNTILVLTLLFVTASSLFSQISKDSISAFLSKYPKKDTNRINALVKLSSQLAANLQSEPSIALAEEALNLAKGLKTSKFIFSALCAVGGAKLSGNQIEEGTKFFLKALALAQKNPSAAEPSDRVQIYFRLAIAIKTRNPNQGLSYIKDGYRLAKTLKLPPIYLGVLLDEVAEIFLILPNQVDSSAYYNQLAIDIFEKIQNVYYLNATKLTQAIILNVKKSPQTALSVLKEIEPIVTKSDRRDAIRWHEAMATTQRMLKNYSLAIRYSLKGATLIGTDNPHHEDVANYYKDLAELFELNGQADSSNHYFKKTLQALAKAQESKEEELAANIEAKYRANDQRRQNQLLQVKNQQIKLTYSYYVGLSIALLVILTVLVISYSKLRQKNRQIAEQSQQLVSFNSQLSDALLDVKTLTDAKRQLVSLFVHDLRTPLQIIQLKLGLFDLQYPENKIVAQLQSASERIHLTLLKIIEAENENLIKMENTLEPILISPLVQEVIDRLKAVAVPKRLQLSFSEPSAPVEIVASYELLSHVVENLVSNAIKFSPEKGKIKVAVNTSPDKVMISVKDEGAGIPEDKIIELFKTRSPKIFGNESGLGVGLSLCRNYMELMRGVIRAESVPGMGTTFYLEFDKK